MLSLTELDIATPVDTSVPGTTPPQAGTAANAGVFIHLLDQAHFQMQSDSAQLLNAATLDVSDQKLVAFSEFELETAEPLPLANETPTPPITPTVSDLTSSVDLNAATISVTTPSATAVDASLTGEETPVMTAQPEDAGNPVTPVVARAEVPSTSVASSPVSTSDDQASEVVTNTAPLLVNPALSAASDQQTPAAEHDALIPPATTTSSSSVTSDVGVEKPVRRAPEWMGANAEAPKAAVAAEIALPGSRASTTTADRVVATTVGETEPHVAVSTTPQAVQQLARDAAALQPQVAPGRVNGQVFHQADEALQTSLPSAAELGLRRLSADQSLATRDAEAPVQMQLADPVVSPVREKVVDSVIGTRPDVQDAANDRLLSPLRLAAVANDVRGDALAPANTLAHASLVTGMTATATGDALAPHQLPAGTLSLKAPDWDQRMGSNVAFMLKENVSTARIHMKPEELGSMSVQVSVQSDRLSVTLAAANPMTRDALEASLPRLREQFSALGFSDVDVNVGDSGQSGRDPRGMDERNGTPENNGYYLSSTGSDTQEVAPVSERVVIQRGLLDTFA